MNGGVVATREVVQQADLVVFVGCRAGSTTTERWTQPSRDVPIVHIDVDPAVVSANYRTAHALIGDARLALDGAARPADGRAAGPVPRPPPGRPSSAGPARPRPTPSSALAGSLDRPIRPERVIAELNRVLPRDAVVVADPGTPCPYVSAYYELQDAGRSFLTNRAHGALGYSMAAALGAWFADSSRKCVSIMGDGSFGFAVGELETVVRCKAPLLMLVLSNATYGWIKASQKASYGERYFSVDFARHRPRPDRQRLRRRGRGGSRIPRRWARCCARPLEHDGRRWSTSSPSRWKMPPRRSCSGWVRLADSQNLVIS